MTIETVTIERILPTAIWIEDDICGGRHVMLQHEGMQPFCYASFHYDYAYTSNSGTWAAAIELAKALGATEPIERRHRPGWPAAAAVPEALPLRCPYCRGNGRMQVLVNGVHVEQPCTCPAAVAGADGDKP